MLDNPSGEENAAYYFIARKLRDDGQTHTHTKQNTKPNQPNENPQTNKQTNPEKETTKKPHTPVTRADLRPVITSAKIQGLNHETVSLVI